MVELTQHFLVLACDLNPGIYAKPGMDYSKVALPGAVVTLKDKNDKKHSGNTEGDDTQEKNQFSL